MTITTNDLVQREVIYCVSHMVDTIAKSDTDGRQKSNELRNACHQAWDLLRGQPNYEAAAHDEGWELACASHPDSDETDKDYWFLKDGEFAPFDSWQELCEHYDIEPYETEVFEHWIVSTWLADKLIAKCETVDKDFMGLTVWARTTTGQAIAMDAVIQEIHAELVK